MAIERRRLNTTAGMEIEARPDNPDGVFPGWVHLAHFTATDHISVNAYPGAANSMRLFRASGDGSPNAVSCGTQTMWLTDDQLHELHKLLQQRFTEETTT